MPGAATVAWGRGPSAGRGCRNRSHVAFSLAWRAVVPGLDPALRPGGPSFENRSRMIYKNSEALVGVQRDHFSARSRNASRRSLHRHHRLLQGHHRAGAWPPRPADRSMHSTTVTRPGRRSRTCRGTSSSSAPCSSTARLHLHLHVEWDRFRVYETHSPRWRGRSSSSWTTSAPRSRTGNRESQEAVRAAPGARGRASLPQVVTRPEGMSTTPDRRTRTDRARRRVHVPHPRLPVVRVTSSPERRRPWPMRCSGRVQVRG